MTRRRGATLREVLVAIFVMGIRLIARLALFPIGVVSMAQAIQDDRAAHCNNNATAIAIARNIRNDALVTAAFKNPGDPSTADATADGPSWPVYVDPIGQRSYLAPYNS